MSSVSCEQIRVALFFFITLCHPERVSGSHFIFSKWFLILFFITPRHPELDSGSHFFSKWFLIFFFFITSLFLFFYKNYYYFTKGKEPARSPKPAVLNLSYLQWIYLPVWLRLASTGLLFLQVKAKQLLTQSFLTLFLLYKQRCKARSLCLG